MRWVTWLWWVLPVIRIKLPFATSERFLRTFVPFSLRDFTYLFNNQLSGSIPTELGQLEALTVFVTIPFPEV
jgi:hypothetical protein